MASRIENGAICRVCGTAAGYDRVLKTLDQCRECRFVTYLPGEHVDVAHLYTDDYFSTGDYPDYLGQQDAVRRSMRRHLRQMARYQSPGGPLLEVGCAYGLFLDEARTFFSPVKGVDICEGPVEYARNALGVDAVAGDFLTLDFGRQKFNAICFWDTVEHLTAPERFIARAAGLLAPDGRMFLTTADIGSLNARIRGAGWRQIHPPTHLHYFSRATLSVLLERLGLEILGVETAAYYHSMYNVLATLGMKPNFKGRIASAALSLVGERLARRPGLWINLRDIMFVAVRRSSAK
jgi:2-polyprenyl-3-methyl-5-hydroxy-6-metoxy-1,4-benzoquinol methylase